MLANISGGGRYRNGGEKGGRYGMGGRTTEREETAGRWRRQGAPIAKIVA